jgi:alpha-N-arabinofuranosidase
MAAEMFFNRSFEPFYPYREINKHWFDLHYDERNWGAGFEKDWRVFDWYHSAYEHSAWFAFPGVAGHQLIDDDSTFVIEKSPTADVRIGYVEDACHGKSAMQVVNESGEMGGLAQEGKYCTPSTLYHFKGKIKSVAGERELTVALYREGTTDQPVILCPLDPIGEDFTPVTATLSVPDEGRYTFVLLLPPYTTVVCDDFSMTPSDAVGGFKKNAVEVGKYVSPKVMRWPGGCFASFYNWRNGVGPNRPPMYSEFWGGYQSNDIGTDELATYVEAVGGESMICINMHHPLKRFYDAASEAAKDRDPNVVVEGDDSWLHGRDLPEFMDKEQGAREAAAWVEYCNGDETTEGGRARIANGRVKPYNVKYWEMDNEIHRWFHGDEYAEACVMYSRAMKAVDPTIKIGMISYCHGGAQLERMVEIAGMDIDFLADRGFDERDLQFKLGIIDRFNKAHGTNIRFCNTEWLPLNGADVYNMVPRSELRHNKCFMFSKWSYALDAAATLMMWQRYGQSIDFINFNNWANTHAQSVIETPKEGAFVAASGMMLHRFAFTQAYQTLQIEDYHPTRTDGVQVQLSVNEAGDALVLNLLNRTEEDGEIELDLTAFNVPDGEAAGVLLAGGDLLAMNTLSEQAIREVDASVTVTDRVIKTAVPRLSYGEYIIPMA